MWLAAGQGGAGAAAIDALIDAGARCVFFLSHRALPSRFLGCFFHAGIPRSSDTSRMLRFSVPRGPWTRDVGRPPRSARRRRAGDGAGGGGAQRCVFCVRRRTALRCAVRCVLCLLFLCSPFRSSHIF